jgi:hypothetical protein
VSAPFAAGALFVASGLLDRFSGIGRVSSRAFGSLVVYWLLSCALVVATTRRVRLVRFWRDCWTRNRAAVLTVALSSVMAVGAAEVGLRIATPYAAMRPLSGVPSDELHHIYPPNVRMYGGLVEGRHVVVDTNEDGLRTKYRCDDFLRYEERIILLGDSFTFGLGVRQEATVPEVAERLLRERCGGRSVAVLNAGIISSSPLLAERLFAERLRRYRPTLVVLTLDATDFGDDYRYAQQAIVEDGLVRFDLHEPPRRYHGPLLQLAWRASGWLRHAIAYPFEVLGGRVGEEDDYYRFELDLGGVTERNRFFIYRHPPELTEPFFRATVEYVDRLASSVRQVGGEFLLVISPRFHHWSARECPENMEAGYALDEPYESAYLDFFDTQCNRLDYPLLNLLPHFRAARQFPLVFRDDPHWNEAGHAFVANVLAEHLIESGLVGRR